MTRFFHDPLLHGTRGLLRIAYLLCFAVAVFLAVAAAIGSLAAGSAQIGTTSAQYRDGAVLIAALVPLLAIVGWFLRILWQIVGTVATGDPFAGANADRLTRMAWLALLLKGVSVAQNIAFDGSRLWLPSSGGLLLALTLFILARVFRQGAAMREDLEGTV